MKKNTTAPVTVPISCLGYDTTKEVSTLHSVPPQNHAGASLQSAEKRMRLRGALNAYADTIRVKPVQSNKELIERGEQYFKFCADRLLYPTREGLASFCGYSDSIFFQWPRISGGRFQDGRESTSDILDRLKGIIDSIEGDLVQDGSVDKIQWIFRRKAQSGWVEKQPEIIPTPSVPDVLPPEEIEKLLPELVSKSWINE